jgi:hypothetical protein
MSRGPNVIDLEPKNPMLAALEGLERQMPEFQRFAVYVVKLRKAAYDAAIKEGFSKEQALELAKSPLGVGIVAGT